MLSLPKDHGNAVSGPSERFFTAGWTPPASASRTLVNAARLPDETQTRNPFGNNHHAGSGGDGTVSEICGHQNIFRIPGPRNPYGSTLREFSSGSVTAGRSGVIHFSWESQTEKTLVQNFL